MCQIQFIKRIDNSCLSEKDLTEFFKLMLLGNQNNNDAFGFFNSKMIYRNKGSFNLMGFTKSRYLNKDSFLIGHNRFTTSGHAKNPLNNHPFNLNDFVLVHNGVINNDEELKKQFKINTKIQTDSFIILWLIDNFFKKSKKIKRLTKIKQAIKKTAKLLNGSFSVFLYDKVENNIFYFKNDKTNFSFCLLDDKLLIGSTEQSNMDLLYLNKKYVFDHQNFKEKLVKEIDNNKIYLINDEIIIKEIGSFKDYSDKIGFYDGYNYVNDYKDEWVNYNKDYVYNENELLSNNKRQAIDSFFMLNMGYTPFYDITEDGKSIKITREKRILNDIKCFFDKDEIILTNDEIILSIDDILYMIENYV